MKKQNQSRRLRHPLQARGAGHQLRRQAACNVPVLPWAMTAWGAAEAVAELPAPLPLRRALSVSPIATTSFFTCPKLIDGTTLHAPATPLGRMR